MSSYISRVSDHIQTNLLQMGKSLKEGSLIDYSLFSGALYAGCACTSFFTKVPILCNLSFISLAFLIDQVTSPLLADLCESERNITGIPLVVHLTHLGLSTFTARQICRVTFKHSITFPQTVVLGSVFLSSLFATKKMREIDLSEIFDSQFILFKNPFPLATLTT